MFVNEQSQHRRAAIDLLTRLSFILAVTIVFLVAGRAAGQEVSGSATVVPNIALTAKVSASSEHDDRYRAENAIDGIVPIGLCKEDHGTAWATRGAENGFMGWFQFEWEKPVDVAEIVYFGRTAQLIEECFKNYEVYVVGSPAPVAAGTLQEVDGPQRITFPKVRARSLKLIFLDSYTSRFNPGASEIAVFAESVTDRQLQQMLHGESRSEREEEMFAALCSGKLGFDELLVIKRHHMALSHVYTYHVEGFIPGGGLYAYKPDPVGGTFRQIVDAGQGEIVDADLSYDGREIVFSWKRGGPQMLVTQFLEADADRSVPEHNYQIWRVNIDGTGLTQLTDLPYNNLNACWLPDGGIAFISDSKPAYAYCWVTTSPVLYRMDRNGKNRKRLSANYLMDFTPAVLDDGRLIFTRWEYVDRPACPIQSLWTISPDGTGLAGYYGNRVISPGTFMEANSIPGTEKVLCLATNHNGDCRGAICMIDPTKGTNAPEAVENLTPEVDMYRVGGVHGNGMNGPYEKPFPIDDRHYLVTKRGVVQIRSYQGDRCSFLFPQEGMGFYSVQPIRTVEVPPAISTVRLDESVKLAEDGSVSGSWATVFVQDVYQGLEPHVGRGEIKRIAVVQEVEKPTFSPFHGRACFGFQFPLVSCGATYAAKQLWGFADVAEDGSACFKVPSEVPIYFMALDAEGRAVQRMRTFTHLMPGEVQSCVGCHADRNQISPHKLGQAPAMLDPQELQRPEWGVKGFSYSEVVQPVWDKYCVECHHAHDQPGGVDLTGDRTDFFNVSYDHLARKGTLGEQNYLAHGVPVDSGNEGRSPFTNWIWTINGSELSIHETTPKYWGSPASKLSEIIASGHPDTEGSPRFAMKPEDRQRVYLWIDLNVPYYPTSSSNHPDRLGCRHMLPEDLQATLAEVAGRRCAVCHAEEVPRAFYTRIENPQHNSFLLAPLAKEAGGTETCGTAVFKSTSDPDYQKLLGTFRPIQALLKASPRADMPSYVMPDCAAQTDP